MVGRVYNISQMCNCCISRLVRRGPRQCGYVMGTTFGAVSVEVSTKFIHVRSIVCNTLVRLDSHMCATQSQPQKKLYLCAHPFPHRRTPTCRQPHLRAVDRLQHAATPPRHPLQPLR